MRILVAVAVVLVLVIVIAGIVAYRRRALANDHASAQWIADVRPTGSFSYGRSDLQVGIKLVTPRGTILQKIDTEYIDGEDDNFQQSLFNAQIDAQNQATQMNGLNNG